jgi:hypothetical protein
MFDLLPYKSFGKKRCLLSSHHQNSCGHNYGIIVSKEMKDYEGKTSMAFRKY